jgi:hypothetical protein
MAIRFPYYFTVMQKMKTSAQIAIFSQVMWTAPWNSDSGGSVGWWSYRA